MNTKDIAAEYRLAHWAQIAENRRDSGLSIKAYYKQAGFHENRYYYWQKKLREAASEDIGKIQGGAAGMMPAAFVEVKPATETELSQRATNHQNIDQNQVSVETAGMRITAGNGYPADKLAYLLRAVM